MGTLYVMCGIAGIGKSTFAEDLAHMNDPLYTTIVSSDAVRGRLYGDPAIQGSPRRVFKEVYDEVGRNLPYRDVILDSTALTVKDRMKIINTFKDVAEGMIVVVFEPNVEKAVAQDKLRERHVGREVIERQAHKFQMPTLREGWNLIWVAGANQGETCVSCGSPVPEGTMVCKRCLDKTMEEQNELRRIRI